MLKLTIAVPLGAHFVNVLHNAVVQANLDNARAVLQESCGQSYEIYRGGHHIALHEKAPHSHICAAYGKRVAMIQDN